MILRKLFVDNKPEIMVVLIFLFIAFGFNIYRVQGSDGLNHYRLLEKMLYISNPECPLLQYNKHPSFEQSGCAFFNAPFYLAAYTLERVLKLNINFNGITLRQIAINLASNFYIALSLILLVKILKLFNFKYKILPVLSILFSTSAFTVGVIQPSWNHSVDIFVNSLLTYLFLSYFHEKNSKKTIWLGMVLTISILVRYFNFLWGIAFFLFYIITKEYRKLLFFLFGFIGTAWIIPLLFYAFNGSISPLATTSISATTIKSFGCVASFPKYVIKLLVHPLHGLFIWSPSTIFSALGLVFLPKEKEKMGYLFLGIWSLFLILYGFIPSWNAGWSFSNRYLVSLFPVYTIGLSAFLEKHKRMLWLAMLATIYSIILFLNWHLCIMNPEFGTPADAAKAWLKGESDTSVDTIVSLKVALNRLWEYCRYKYILRIFN